MCLCIWLRRFSSFRTKRKIGIGGQWKVADGGGGGRPPYRTPPLSLL